MYKLNKTLVCFLILTIVSSALAFRIVISAYRNYDDIYDESYSTEQPRAVSHSDLVNVSFPKANQLITSPLVVKGEARGNWYFEASFPVRLLDASGKELAATPAQAQGEWMTTEFVPFEATLNFIQPTTPTGTIVLQRDNPSGLPKYEASISIPVRF